MRPEDVVAVHRGAQLVIPDEQGADWHVHTFAIDVSRYRLKLDWEHDAYRWTTAPKVKRFFNRVPWLDLVLEEIGHLNGRGDRKDRARARILVSTGEVRS